jgi:copper(I)-binding protein
LVPTAPARRVTTRRALGLGVLALALALVPVLAGCAAHSVPAPDITGDAQQIISTPGSLTIVAPPEQPDAPAMRITGAVLVPGPQGNEELRMTLWNQSAAPDRLYGASSANAKTVTLFTSAASPSANPQPAGVVGITLNPGSNTVFGPGGPRILLEDPSGFAHTRTITVTLLFSVGGIVHLTVPSPVSATGQSS